MKRKEMELFLRMRRWTARYIKKKRKEHFHSSFPTLLWASISRTSKSFLVKWASRVPRNYLSTSVLKCLVEKADCEVPMTSGCFLKKNPTEVDSQQQDFPEDNHLFLSPETMNTPFEYLSKQAAEWPDKTCRFEHDCQAHPSTPSPSQGYVYA